jgi:hypothetical protein
MAAYVEALSSRRPAGTSGRTVAVAALTVALIPLVLMPRVVQGQPANSPAGVTRSPEYAVKAAFIYNFAKFVEWPPGALPSGGSTFNVCVLGQDPFGEVLDSTVAGKAIGGRMLAVERVASPSDAASCSIVFIGASEAANLARVLGRLQGTPVLTVGDLDRFADRGGMIGLFVENSRVRFAINTNAAERAHLRISSALLNLARIVSETPAKGK